MSKKKKSDTTAKVSADKKSAAGRSKKSKAISKQATTTNQAENLKRPPLEPEILEEVLEKEGISKEKSVQITAHLMSVAEQYSGPLPLPKHFKMYEDTCSGAAKRILAHMEKEQSHRHDMESRGLSATENDAKRGQILGSALIACMILGALFCAYIKATVIGLALVAAPLLTEVRKVLATAFNNKDKKDKDEK